MGMTMKRLFGLLFLFFLVSLHSAIADGLVTLSGKVVDEAGEPLVGCVVRLKDSQVATTTDLDGNFKINVPAGSSLEFSSLGFQTVTLKGKETSYVVMKVDAFMLEEVVAVGYGTMKRSDITGSVASIKADDMQQSSAVTMDQMLQGKAAGVQLTGNSGAAGASTSIQIRGVNSLSSTNEPVYVIDGSIVRSEAGDDTFSNPLADLNPNDVESIEILKDASATAIYGSQAANGVIIVNMKKGIEGSPRVTFKATAGVEMVPRRLDVMNLRDLAQWVRELNSVSDGNAANDLNTTDYFASPQTLGEGTDWQSALFREAVKQEYNVSVRGGTKSIKYSLSGGYLNQEGIVVNNDFSRFTARAGMDVKAYKWLDLGFTVNIAQTDRNTGMSQWGVVENALGQTPNIPVKNADGTWGKSGYNSETRSWQPNPVAIASVTTRLNKVNSVRANIYAVVKPWKWLNWKTEATYDTNTDNYRYLLPEYDFGGTIRDYATHESSKTFNQYLSMKSVATGKWKKSGHDISAMAGIELNSRYRDYVFGRRLGGSNSNQSLSGGDASRDENAGWTTTQRFFSYFGRLTYNYRNRYMLTATLRRDGSSLFEKGHRWGTFPSAAVAWRVSEEPFWGAMAEVMNNFKLRAGYGIVGNANLADSSYQPNFSNLASSFGTSYKTANMPNYGGLTWEKTDSWNVGVDMTFLDNRVELIFDAFLKNTRDLLLQTAQPYYTGSSITGGTTAQWANVGSMMNRGIELTINAHLVDTRNFKWKTSLTGSLVENEITGLNTATGFIDKTLSWSTWTETVTRTAVGYGVSQYYGYQVAGRINSAADFLRNNGDGTSTVIAATPNYRIGTVVSNGSATALKTSIGDLLYKDNNGDGLIDANDMTFLGNGLPKYTFGWNNTFTIRGFSLSMFFYGSLGNEVFNWTRRRMDEPSMIGGAASNKFTRVNGYARWCYYDGNTGNDDVWNVYVSPDSDPLIPRIDNQHGNFNSRVSDRYVEKADYLRLKNVVLTYSFPKRMIKKLKLQKLALTANVQNVYTFTGYSGFDPEVGSQNGQYSMSGQGMLMYGVDTGKIPTPRSFILGVELTF